MEHPDRIISDLASTQHGAIGRRQLVGDGVTGDQVERRVETRRMEAVYRSVYRVGGAPKTWQGSLSELLLAGGGGTAVSHRAAVELWGIFPFGHFLEVVTPRSRRFRVQVEDPIIHTSVVLPDGDVAEKEGLAVTTVERSLLDLGAVVSRRKVVYAVDAALRLGLTDHDRLADLLSRRRKKGRRGVRALDQALATGREVGVPGSRYERDVLELIREMGVPEPVTQHRIVLPSSRVVHLDIAWPALRLGIEIDGHGSHATRTEREYDATRQNEVHLEGWTLLRFTTNQIFERPSVVYRTIFRAISPFL